MTPEIEALKKDIEEQLLSWSALFIEQRKAFLRRRKIEASGKLLGSMEAEINRQARAEVVQILIAFEEHGRFQDMKRMNVPQGGGEYLAALVEWIRKKGLEQKMIAGWQRRYNRKTVPADVLNKIAWGIAVKRTQRYRRKAWWNKPKSAAITDLFNDVASSIPDTVAEQIKKNFHGR